MIIFNSTASDNEIKKVFDKIGQSIGKGKILSSSLFGKKNLSYSIKKQTEGIYWLLNFHADGKEAKSVNNILKMNELVLRYLQIKQIKKSN